MMDPEKETTEEIISPSNQAVKKEEKKVLIYHREQEYLCQKDNIILWRGQEQKDDNARPITDPESYFQKFIFDLFSQHFEHVTVLTAAGTSIDNGEKKGMGRTGLWDRCKEKLLSIKEKIDPVKLEDKKFWIEQNLEDALTYIISYQSLCIKDIDSELNEIKKIIRESCTLELDSNAPHEEFLRKITARKVNSSRVQLFTTNYDTLWEQAASHAGFTIIDGFSFSHPRKFSGRYFDMDIVNREKTRIKNEDNFVPNVIHLYKLHGSLDWRQDEEDIIQSDNVEQNALVIYPASNKYEISYKQPYFEMMSRFQQALRKDNVLLLIMGFGFQDMHIKNIIVEAVKQNPSLHIVILDYNPQKSIDVIDYKNIFSGAMSKVTIIFGTFSFFTKYIPINRVYQDDIYEKDL